MYVNQGGSSITLIVGKPVTLSATNVCVGDVPLVDWIRRLGSPVPAAVVSRRGVRITDWAPRIPVHDPGSPRPGSRHTSTASVCLLSPSTPPHPLMTHPAVIRHNCHVVSLRGVPLSRDVLGIVLLYWLSILPLRV